MQEIGSWLNLSWSDIWQLRPAINLRQLTWFQLRTTTLYFTGIGSKCLFTQHEFFDLASKIEKPKGASILVLWELVNSLFTASKRFVIQQTCISSFSPLSELSCPKFKRWSLHPLHGNCSIPAVFLLILFCPYLILLYTVDMGYPEIYEVSKHKHTHSIKVLSALFSVTSPEVTKMLFALLITDELFFLMDFLSRGHNDSTASLLHTHT